MLKFSKGHKSKQKGDKREQFCEIILKSGHWPRRCRLMFFFSNFSSGGHFVQLSRTILAILVKYHKRITSVKLL